MIVSNFGEPMGGRTFGNGRQVDSLQKIEDRSYKSYKGRMYASQRLALRGKAWNASLLSLTVATTIASIGLLTNDGMYGAAGPTVFACLAVLSLVISLVVAGQNYNGRSRDLFNNYRRLQRLSTEAEYLRDNNDVVDQDKVEALLSRYNDLLDDSENHSEADYERTLDEGSRRSWLICRDRFFSALPYVSLIVPLLVLMPFLVWIIDAI